MNQNPSPWQRRFTSVREGFDQDAPQKEIRLLEEYNKKLSGILDSRAADAERASEADTTLDLGTTDRTEIHMVRFDDVEAAHDALFGTDVDNKAPNIEVLWKTFVDLIFRQETISKAMVIALQHDDINQSVFRSNIEKAVKAFAAQLLDEKPNDQPICKIFQGYSPIISSRIINEALTRASLNTKMSEAVVVLPLGAESSEEEKEESQDDIIGRGTGEADAIGNDTPGEGLDVMTFQDTVSSSRAFGTLLDNLHDIVFPTFNSRLRQLMDREKEESGPSAETKLGELFSELAYARASHIEVSLDTPGYIDWLQLCFERGTRQQWTWSPLRQPLQPLREGEVRISWKCACHKTRRATVSKQVAERLVAIAKMPSSDSGTSSDDSSGPLDSPSSQPGSGSTARTSQAGDDPSLKEDMLPDTQIVPKDPEVIDERASLEQQLPRGTIYFMTAKGAFHPRQEGLVRSFITSNDKCDHQFFAELKEEYWKHRGLLRRYLGMYGFKGCDFFKLRTYKAGRYGEMAPGLPSAQDLGYSFKTRNPQPQVSAEEFRDHFHGCQCTESSCKETSTLDYIPRKVNAGHDQPPVVIKDEIFWGIIAREDDKNSVYMLAVYVSLVYLCFGIGIAPMFVWLDTRGVTDEASLANRKDNLSNAVVPFNMMFCFLGPVLAAVFA
ncbi:hypothetical protein F5X68DRAFT_25679 [Plectosphaerella plurivora]|uniref:Uncharacterized protein n=1 Tax=Plectosphaerella plurivora TaxID=936078 RepID=A0A9P8V7I5_9PEZI|nr:hypothetical protein F5X68DRAFT_25679 [Plectosphaerella plurivora]